MKDTDSMFSLTVHSAHTVRTRSWEEVPATDVLCAAVSPAHVCGVFGRETPKTWEAQSGHLIPSSL